MTAPNEVMIREPIAWRVVGAVIAFLFFCVGVILFITTVWKNPVTGLVTFWFAVAPVFIGLTNWRQRVCTIGDSLHVRNFLRDHVFDRSSVAGFSRMDPIHRRHASGPSLLGGTLVVNLADRRTLVLYVTFRGPIGRMRLVSMQNDLERWLKNE